MVISKALADKLRRKFPLDSVDRDILRLLKGSRRPLSGNSIAGKVNRTAAGIKPRLTSLNSQGLIKPFKIGKKRVFNRKFGKNIKEIRAPSKIEWITNTKKKRK